MKTPIVFDIALGKTKPENIRHADAPCPFCDTEKLTNILEQEGPTIWLLNKYPVLHDSWQTVIIETDDCHGEFSRYDPKEAARILDFSLRQWYKTIETGLYKSVIFFKNFGPMSGGSLRHPHSQIIGLKEHDYCESIEPYHFEGWSLYENKGIKLTLSSQPLIGFFEFNIVAEKTTKVELLASTMQATLSYILKDFSKYSSSYNVFFYNLHDGLLYVKIVPRFLTTPLYVGYKLPQVCNEARAMEIQKEIQPYLQKFLQP